MLKVALPREYHPALSRYSGADLGVDIDKFAYFAISMVWRGAVHDWVVFDYSSSHRTGRLPGTHAALLMGKAPIPPGTSVI